MKRLLLAPRKNWRQIAEDNGFHFHHVDGDLYWDESVCYSFTLREIEDKLEDAAQELHDMCMDFAGEAVNSEKILESLKIPEMFWDKIRNDWQNASPSIYGRMDLAYDGAGNAKLLEYNADTPTALYEAAYFQWLWLEDMLAGGIFNRATDQFNSIQECLIEAFAQFKDRGLVHFAAVKGSEEDRATVEYIVDCARQAGVLCSQIYMEDIGWNGGAFIDLANLPIRALFKLYPWEYIWRDSFAPQVCALPLIILEPSWKMVLSNKGLLPHLWRRNPNHPNLLSAWFEGETALARNYARKPLLSREGADIELVRNGTALKSPGRGYGQEGHICQELAPLPCFDGNYPVIGAWIVNGKSCGIGIREEAGEITTDASRFVPHIIEE